MLNKNVQYKFDKHNNISDYAGCVFWSLNVLKSNKEHDKAATETPTANSLKAEYHSNGSHTLLIIHVATLTTLFYEVQISGAESHNSNILIMLPHSPTASHTV